LLYWQLAYTIVNLTLIKENLAHVLIPSPVAILETNK